MTDDPIERFDSVLKRATETERFDATRAALATVDSDGHPTARFVLVRGHGPDGFTFYTNYGSHKAAHLDRSRRAALAFHWESIGEQVRIEGTVERTSAEASDDYFASRPRGSQLGAWASQQSEVIPGREVLTEAMQEAEARFEGRDVERPPQWGGYLLWPERMEFWINGEDRLHDRFLYERTRDGWSVRRLAP